MERYVRKPVEVEAEQYFDGKEISEIYINFPLLFEMYDITDFENQKKYFYVSNCNGKNWLSVEKFNNGKRDIIPFEHTLGNNYSYIRKIKFDIDDPLVQIYLEEFDLDWPIPHTYLRGSDEIVKNSDWIVKEDGVVKVYSSEDFENKFDKDSHIDFYDSYLEKYTQMYKCLAEDIEVFSAEFRKNNL